MAGKISAGMEKVQKEVTRRMRIGFCMEAINFAELAKQYGTTANSVYRSAWYRDLKAAQK